MRDHRVGNRAGDGGFSAGRRRQPGVGIQTSERQPRRNPDETSVDVALSPRAKPCIRFGELDIRDPGLEELRTKTEDEVRAIEVVAREFASATRAIRRRTN